MIYFDIEVILSIDEDGYRIRISNFPPNATREEIFKRLQLKYVPNQENLVLTSTEPIIAYFTNHKSKSLTKSMIHTWHNQLFSTNQQYKMKCQLEINVEYFNSTVGVPLASTPINRSRAPSLVSSMNSVKNYKTAATLALQKRCTELKTCISIDHSVEDELKNKLNISELSSSWDWENAKLLDERSNEVRWMYSSVNKIDPTKQAEITIYSTISNRTAWLRAQRQKVVLERLQSKYE